MSCTGCGSNFGLLKKEVGCETCGFAFCSKCCSKRSVVKNGATLKQLMCNKCYADKDRESVPKTYSPPMQYKKRMAAFANRSVSLGSNQGPQESSQFWGNEKDKEIAERLQKLKRERNKDLIPSDSELEERVAKLKGMDPAKYKAPPVMVYRPDRRTSQEQISELLTQVQEEAELDASLAKRDDEIAARLAALRGETHKKKDEVADHVVPTGGDGAMQEEMDIDEEHRTVEEQFKKSHQEALQELTSLKKDKELKEAIESVKSKPKEEVGSEEPDEDEEAEQLVEQLLAATKLDSVAEDPESLNGAEVQTPDSEKTGSIEDQEEFPWCVLCTEDAKIRCFGCDGDLYCMKCFRECHDSLDIKDHKTCPFLPPRK